MFDVKPVTTSKATACGAACMNMLLEYYGDHTPFDDLYTELGTGISGITAKDVLRVGRAHGLDMKSYKMDADEVARQDRPSVIWWKYNHFVICCGMNDAGQVVICNPSRGRYGMSLSLFSAFYSGIALFNGEPEDLPTA